MNVPTFSGTLIPERDEAKTINNTNSFLYTYISYISLISTAPGKQLKFTLNSLM